MLNLVVLQAGCFPRRAVQVVGWLLAGDNFQQTILKLSANSQQLSSTLSNSLEALEWNEDQNEIRPKSEPQLSSPLISFFLQASSRDRASARLERELTMTRVGFTTHELLAGDALREVGAYGGLVGAYIRDANVWVWVHRVGALDSKEHQLDAPQLICIPYFHRQPPAPARRAEPARSSKSTKRPAGRCCLHRASISHRPFALSRTAVILHGSGQHSMANAASSRGVPDCCQFS